MHNDFTKLLGEARECLVRLDTRRLAYRERPYASPHVLEHADQEVAVFTKLLDHSTLSLAGLISQAIREALLDEEIASLHLMIKLRKNKQHSGWAVIDASL